MKAPNALPWRVSLRMLLLLMALFAIGCSAMTHANEAWLLAVTTTSLLIFMAAGVMAVIDRGGRQAFAIGFLLCGGLHWAAMRWIDDMPTRHVLEESYYLIGKAGFHVGRSSQVGGAANAGAKSLARVKFGDKGAPVSALQAALNERVSPSPLLEVDGDFGARTKQAVITFQKSHGLPASGIVTPTTWQALGPSATRTLKLNGISGLLTATPAGHFVQIGGWLVTLLVAYLGGHFATALYVRGWKESAQDS